MLWERTARQHLQQQVAEAVYNRPTAAKSKGQPQLLRVGMPPGCTRTLCLTRWKVMVIPLLKGFLHKGQELKLTFNMGPVNSNIYVHIANTAISQRLLVWRARNEHLYFTTRLGSWCEE